MPNHLTPQGIETLRGAFEKATDAEGNTGTSILAAVTPSVLKAVFDTKIDFSETDTRSKTSADGSATDTIFTVPAGINQVGFMEISASAGITGTATYEVLKLGVVGDIVQTISLPGPLAETREAIFMEPTDVLRIVYNITAGTGTFRFRSFGVVTSF